MPTYRFLLRNERRTGYDRISWLIVLINFVALPAVVLSDGVASTTDVLTLVLLSIALLPRLLLRSWKNRVNFAVLFTSLSIAWILQQFYLPALGSLFFGFLYRIATRPLPVEFTAAQVKFPSFPPRRLDWETFSNVVLKDGVLTIDFRNNRLMQQPVETPVSREEEEEFNEFCRQQLHR